MSYFIRIFCTTECSTSRAEFIEFIEEGVYFDDEFKFDLSLDSPEAKDPDWNILTVNYNANLRPVIFERNIHDDLQKEEIDEFLFILSASRETKGHKIVKQHLESTVLTFSIDIKQESLTEDCWDMLASLESYLCKKCNGLIYAPDDGFYNSKLKRIYKF